ncbi:cupredoxin domain-containing protein [Reyranella sp.]|jgi:cytochrome c oxidase subunit 2|uniref:cupredoxin domain-containing protein n=1 Tax=Reyranella sp. TaxID=1929291 RepID=UPI002F949980
MRRRYLIALLIAGSAAGGVARLAAATPNEVEIMAMKFDFTPDTIKVKAGQPVTLVLTSIDRVHGFKMPDFGVRTDIVPGLETRVTITPAKAGTFAYFCDVFCGDGHEEMSGTLIVET